MNLFPVSVPFLPPRQDPRAWGRLRKDAEGPLVDGRWRGVRASLPICCFVSLVWFFMVSETKTGARIIQTLCQQHTQKLEP